MKIVQHLIVVAMVIALARVAWAPVLSQELPPTSPWLEIPEPPTQPSQPQLMAPSGPPDLPGPPGPPSPWQQVIAQVSPYHRGNNPVPRYGKNCPAGRQSASLVYDWVTDRAILFGGMTLASQWYPHSWYNDVWILVNAFGKYGKGPPSWKKLRVRGEPPGPRAFHTAVYDIGSDRMIVFGGYRESGYYLDGRRYSDPQGTQYQDVWVLTNANGIGPNEPGESGPTWHQAIAQGTPGSPPGRHYHGVGYHPQSNRMVIFAGAGDIWYTSLSDVWVLEKANSLRNSPANWRQVVVEGGPGPRARFAHAYDDLRDILIILGGEADWQMNNEVWALRNACSGPDGPPAIWTQVLPANAPGAPSPRRALPAAYDPVENRLFVFGGYSGWDNFDGTYAVVNAHGLGKSEWLTLAPDNSSDGPEKRRNCRLLWREGSLLLTTGTSGYDGTDFNDVWRLPIPEAQNSTK